MNEQYMRNDLKERVEKELQPGEQVEWLGQPVPRFFTSGSITGFLIGFLFTAFSILWAIGYAIQEDYAFFITLFLASPFWILGLVCLFSPIWSYLEALKTVYFITDKRAITIKAGWSSTTRSYLPDNLQNIYIREKKDGTGDVIISCRDLYGRTNGKKAEELGFLQVRNPKEVENKLKKLAERVVAH